GGFLQDRQPGAGRQGSAAGDRRDRARSGDSGAAPVLGGGGPGRPAQLQGGGAGGPRRGAPGRGEEAPGSAPEGDGGRPRRGRGGGRKDMAQAGGSDPSKLSEALQLARKLAGEKLGG